MALRNGTIKISGQLGNYVGISFAELWIDIEFSGKDENVKGVIIISLDVEVLNRLDLEAGKLFLGRTIVKVDTNILGIQKSMCYRGSNEIKDSIGMGI